MPRFSFKAINENGKTLTGAIQADSVEMAHSLLIERGHIPSSVKEASAGPRWNSWSGIQEHLSSVKAPDLIIFTKQFRTMVRAGVPIVNLLQVLQNQTENPKLKSIIGSITMDIREGHTLFDSFSKYPKVFSSLYCSLIRAGESSGALADVMDRLIYITEHEHKIKSDVKSALQYPIIVAVFLAAAFFILLTFVIPRFTRIFTAAGIELPLPTFICLSLYRFLSDHIYLILGVAIAGTAGIIVYLKKAQGRYIRDTLLLKLPIFGPLFIKAAMSRFTSIFAILHTSGVHVLETIKILSGTIGNAAISREFDQIGERVGEGQGIAGPLRSAGYFTPMVTNMVAIGEESGELGDMLRDVSEHYDDEVNYAIKRLSELIGPFLTVGLAAVVGFFALAIFLPMWDLTKMVK
ncbi:MAG: type II secretion system F family protein [Thermodesulfobacteriota bacterium]|nr:type II secretion system F family protein [Thermodesulfobacteriota bacterium]